MASSHLKKEKTEDSSKDELRMVDAVLAVFCFRSSEGEKRYGRRLKLQAMHRAFDKLREKYPTWLQDMSFTYGPAGTVPVSGVLEDILFDLGTSGIMEVANPSYKFLKIPASRVDIIREAVRQRRNEAEQEELRNLADEFNQLYEAVKMG